MNDALAGISKDPKQAETEGPVHGREGRTTRKRRLRSQTWGSKPGKRNNTSKAARPQEAGRSGRSRTPDFVLPLIFIALAVPAIKDHATAVAALLARGTAVLVAAMPLNLGLITVALVGVLGGLGAEGVAERRRR
jgi:hypothetical protein